MVIRGLRIYVKSCVNRLINRKLIVLQMADESLWKVPVRLCRRKCGLTVYEVTEQQAL